VDKCKILEDKYDIHWPGENEMLDMVKYVRKADYIECIRSKGNFEKALLHSVAKAKKCWSVRVDGELICIFGVCDVSLLGNIGAPWMISTYALEKHPIKFAIHTRDYVDEMKKGYTKLMNYVDVENKLAKKWLKWSGFTLLDPVTHGVSGAYFHPFEMVV
jgi:hypothetical protein